MNITVAKSAGFCFGVKRAVQMVYDEIDKAEGPIYTYGPIIHNEEVISDLRQKGVEIVESPEALADKKPGTVILRSHGVSRREEEAIRRKGFAVCDATCPFVRKIHKLVEEHSRAGDYILITGSPSHPEVQGICGWIKGEDFTVIESREELLAFPFAENRNYFMVSQTTFNLNKFKELVEIVEEKGYHILWLNTICDATEKRQTEARQLAACSDAMIVIGDRKSSNTQKLYEICRQACPQTYYIQTSGNMDYGKLKSGGNVGITAGASTPNYIIEEVSKNVRKL